MYITESEFRKLLNKYDNHCLDCGKKFYDITTLYEASGFKFTTEDKMEIKKAIDANSDPEAVTALVQQKTLENDPQKKNLYKQLKEYYPDFEDDELEDDELEYNSKSRDLSEAEDELVSWASSEMEDLNMSVDETVDWIHNIIETQEEFKDANLDKVLCCVFGIDDSILDEC